MSSIKLADKVFESGCDLLDVTSNHRPDTSWHFVDAAGHEHRWHSNGKPADHYTATNQYDTPSLVWVKDGDEYWEDDDEPHAVGHLECRECGEHISPAYTADTYRQYAPGLRWFTVDGHPVTPEEFQRAFRDAQIDSNLEP